jgi:hypothetical protein
VRDDSNQFQPITVSTFSLNYQCPVEMLATLDGQVQLAFAYDGQQTRHYRVGDISTRRGSDFVTRHLAGAAPHDHYAVWLEPGRSQKAAKGLSGIGR